MLNTKDYKFQKGFPKDTIPESEDVWVTFDGRIHHPALLDVSYQIDGVGFFYKLFKILELFENQSLNSEKIQEMSIKLKPILSYFGVDYSPENLGNLKIIKKELKSLNDVLTLDSLIVFNCSGNGSRTIFNDQNLQSIKGSVLYYKNVNKVQDYYGVETYEDEKFSILTSPEYIVIGVTKSFDKPDIEKDKLILENLMRSVKTFFKPKL